MKDYLLEEFKKVCNAQIPRGCRFKMEIEDDLRYLQEYLANKYHKTAIRQKVSDRIRKIGYSTDLGFDKWFPDRVDFYKNKWEEMTKCPDFVYESLNEIGLENYLRTRGDGCVVKEDWMLRLDSFVKKLPNEQKEILKKKISEKSAETHAQHNNVFHEISIACAFYDSVNFLPEEKNRKTPDFCANGINVEVKTINNSKEEQQRLDELCCRIFTNITQSPLLKRNELEQLKNESINGLSKKLKCHIETAKKQLGSSGGHIWIVYTIDTPPHFRENIREEVKNKFNEIINGLSLELKTLNMVVKYIFFGELRDKIKV